MSGGLDHTHNSALRSWVLSAQQSETEFPLQNLPLGVWCRSGGGEPRIGVAIGEEILDLHRTVQVGGLGELPPALRIAVLGPSLNPLFALGRGAVTVLRHAVHALLREDAALPRPPEECLVPMRQADLVVPATIGDYTDFYASLHHAMNVGSMFRPEQPLLPNYKWVPLGYHGRSSSIVPSGSAIHRPRGQVKDDSAPAPVLQPTRALDYECELGAWVGPGNLLGAPLPLAQAEAHLIGLCLLNDWSARDVQRWEYQPLGPFLSKNFATSISPWVVTLDALEPFRVPAAVRPAGDPALLPYLLDGQNQARGGIAIELEVWLSSAQMRSQGRAPVRLSLSRTAELYWTLAQLVAHHTSNGCRLRPGDLLASGTVSGPARENRGCLLELTWRGSEPLTLPTGETRRFLEDGDEVVLRGSCAREGFATIGFGECRGIVLPAPEPRT